MEMEAECQSERASREGERGGGGESGGKRLTFVRCYLAVNTVCPCPGHISGASSFFFFSLLGVNIHMGSHVSLPGAPCVLFFASRVFGDTRVGDT